MTAPSPAAVERVALAIETALPFSTSKESGWEEVTPDRRRICFAAARAAIAAHTAALAEEGFMIRPREPTAKMQDAGARLARCKGCDGFGEDVHQNDIWRAMADAYEPPGRSEPT